MTCPLCGRPATAEGDPLGRCVPCHAIKVTEPEGWAPQLGDRASYRRQPATVGMRFRIDGRDRVELRYGDGSTQCVDVAALDAGTAERLF